MKIIFPMLSSSLGQSVQYREVTWETSELSESKDYDFESDGHRRPSGVIVIEDEEPFGSVRVDLRWVVEVRASHGEFVLKMRLPALFTDQEGVRKTKEEAWKRPIEVTLRWSDGVWRVALAQGTFRWKRKGSNYTEPDEEYGYQGSLNNWLHQTKNGQDDGLSIELSPHLPVQDLGIVDVNTSSGLGYPKYSQFANIGLFTVGAETTNRRLGLVVVPLTSMEADTKAESGTKKVQRQLFRSLKLLGLKHLRLNHANHPNVLPLIHFCNLGRDRSAPYPWISLLQWRWAKEPPIRDVLLKQFVGGTWNSIVERSRKGLRLSRHGLPWCPLPSFDLPADRRTVPIMVFQHPDQGKNFELRGFFPFRRDGDGTDGLDVELTFDWQTESTVPSVQDALDGMSEHRFQVKGKLSPSRGPWGDVANWTCDTPAIPNPGTYILEAFDRVLKELDDQVLAELDIEELSVDPADHWRSRWLSIGSIDIRPEGPKAEGSHGDHGPEAVLKARGVWGSDFIDLFVEAHVQGVPCRARLGAGSDPPPERLVAVFDSAGRLEEELHSDSGAILAPTDRDPTEVEPGIKGRVSIRMLTARGRDATIEWRIERKDPTTQPVGRTFYLQPKPFTVALLDPPNLESSQSGNDFAYWRSDDPEGPQWRVADSTLTFLLPPQAVGEEMERGIRFWPDPTGDEPKDDKPEDQERKHKEPKSYIKGTRPLGYRFSPPTTVTVQPSLTDRRYHSVPNNLGRALRRARVESFRTEAVYPVATEFRRDAQGEPEVLLSEMQEFLGRPTANLPLVARRESGLDPFFTADVFPDELSLWLDDQPPVDQESIETEYLALRRRHSAARASFASRVARFHLYDPYKPGRELGLRKGLRFTIRSHQSGGAPPLLNPLPTHVPADGTGESWVIEEADLTDGQKTLLQSFLKPVENGIPTWGEEDPDGSLRGGVVHSIEFPSELVAVLRTPVSEQGTLETLSFSALGATGALDVSFDEGRTTFLAEVADGQLHRLVKVRIGRLGVLWNRAKHIVVYERTVVPSEQFEGEQKKAQWLGWPVLRKTEEYLEPIEVVREFESEPQAEQSYTGFLRASELVSPRIYVNGAWGRDLGHGYEIPLWNPKDTSGFYPKPLLALLAEGGAGESNRQWVEEPQEVYFYSNTEAGTGSDPDRWDPKAGVDAPAGRFRVKAMTRIVGDSEWRAYLEGPGKPPRAEGARRARFDLRVRSQGPANLQAQRGDTEMLASLDLVSIARSDEESAGEEWPDEVRELADLSSAYAQPLDAVRRFIARIPEEVLRHPCELAREKLDAEIDRVFDEAGEQVERLKKTAVPTVTAPSIEAELRKELEAFGLLRKEALAALTKPLRDGLRDAEADLDAAIEAGFAAVVRSTFDPIEQRLQGVRKAVQSLVDEAKETHKQFQDHVQGAENALATAITDLENATTGLQKKAGIVRKRAGELRGRLLEISDPKLQPLVRLAARTVARIEGAAAQAATVLEDQNTKGWNEVRGVLRGVLEPVQALNKAILEAVQKLKALENLVGEIEDRLKDLRTLFKQLADADKAVVQKATDDFNVLLDELEVFYGDKVFEPIESELGTLARKADAEIRKLVDRIVTSARRLAELSADYADKELGELRKLAHGAVEKVIDEAGPLCDHLEELQEKLTDKLAEGERELRRVLSEAINDVVDEATRREADKFLGQVTSRVGAGLKLARAIGELPKLPNLTFNVDRAEYVFEDLKKQIATSPFVAKLKEIDAGLKELGLAVPSEALLDQIRPKGVSFDFNKIFKSMGGIDFGHLFKAFRLPKLDDDTIEVTHGTDRATRSAWARARVVADYPEERAAFQVAQLGVFVRGMSLRAQSDVRVDLDGNRRMKTTGRFSGDWSLDFGGARLVTFEGVTVRFDGEDFDFDINPDKIRLHPSIRFVSDITRRLGEKIPPAIEIVKDARGVPTGARANLSTSLTNLPPLGPVTIGPLTIVGGLGLQVAGEFVLKAHLDVGTKQAPIFVQIAWLGGGFWLQSSVTLRGGRVGHAASLGMALGSTRTLSVGGVARASYSILLFASIESSTADGGLLRAGLSLEGSARILGIASAYVRLLLDAIHRSGGGTTGRGTLDVEVEICWCYTLKVHKAVERQI